MVCRIVPCRFLFWRLCWLKLKLGFLYSEHRSHGASGVSVDFYFEFQKVNQTVPAVETRVGFCDVINFSSFTQPSLLNGSPLWRRGEQNKVCRRERERERDPSVCVCLCVSVCDCRQHYKASGHLLGPCLQSQVAWAQQRHNEGTKQLVSLRVDVRVHLKMWTQSRH